MSDIIFIPASSAPGAGVTGNTYEYISKNIRSYPSVLSYTGNSLTTVVYDLGSGLAITKTLSYTGNKLTSIVLSGDLPSGIDTIKTLIYTGNKLTSIVYS